MAWDFARLAGSRNPTGWDFNFAPHDRMAFKIKINFCKGDFHLNLESESRGIGNLLELFIA